MKKRTFLSALVLSATVWAGQALAQPLAYQEGVDYTVLDGPISLRKAGQNEVVEFFSYACPHCANLEPHIVKWAEEQKPKDVTLYQIPAVGGSQWTFTARAKFTAQKLGLGDDFDQSYFDGIHKEKNRKLLGDEKYTFKFIADAAKVDVKDVEKAWNSLQVKSYVVKSNELAKQWQINSVPSVIVNGKYKVNLTNYQKFFGVIDYLLANFPVPPVEAEAAQATKEAAPQVEAPKKAEAAPVAEAAEAPVKTEEAPATAKKDGE